MADDMLSNDEIVSALRDLVQSPGWRILLTQADVEWGPRGYGHQMQKALSTIPAGPDRPYEIARIAEQVDATANAVHAILSWPEDQIRILSSTNEKPKGAFAHLRRIGRS